MTQFAKYDIDFELLNTWSWTDYNESVFEALQMLASAELSTYRLNRVSLDQLN